MRRIALLALALLACGRFASAQLAPGQGMYREGTPYVAGEYGVLNLVVRQDVAAALCTAGEKCPFTVASDGGLWVRFTNASLAVTGPLTDAQLRASPVDGEGSTVNLSDSATNPADAYQVAAFTMLWNGLGTWDRAPGDSINGIDVDLTRLPNEGQQTMANSISVAIASNQSAVPVSGTIAATQSGTWNVTNVSGTVSLPTGASTSANQTTEITALQKIDNLAHAGSDVALVEHVPISAQLDDAATTTVTENQIAPLRLTSGRALHVAQQGTATVTGTVTVGTFPDNEPFNMGQVAGTTTSVNAGDQSAGTIRVVEAGAPTLTTGQVSCANTATQIVAARAGRKAVEVTMLGSADAYVGTSGVTTGNGHLLLGAKGASKSLPSSAAVFCIVASGTQSVSFVEVY